MDLMDDYEEYEQDEEEEGGEYEESDGIDPFLLEPMLENTKGANLEVIGEGNPSEFCRICHESEGELIVPCRCNGTSKFVHPNCLREWRDRFRRRNRGTNSLLRCEICGFRFKTLTVEPNFLDYVSRHWTFFEKIMYTTSLASCVFSIGVSLMAFWHNEGERILRELEGFEFIKRIPNRSNFFGTPKKDKIVLKRLSMMEYFEMVKKGRLAVFIAKNLPQVFLYGWPWNLKLFMTMCMIAVCVGNSIVYKVWKRSNQWEQVLPYSPHHDNESTPINSGDRLD
eukprot:TRINITY_DN6274_c0_g1_i1.p1 TRINITY_DN6274_c0_g1~~TRINITY_DN6274_c0_g1_i1.p1  ORF type:complete len:282 (+),score=63.81 TRINITY_DN6274_c0_g1_i1:116-961(+)